MLRDLTVQNYRCFEYFHIDGLEHVNLFVGNNNSGKTSLLEAIYLLVNFDRSKALSEIINNHLGYWDLTDYSYYDPENLFYQYQTNKFIFINSEQRSKGLLIFLKDKSYLLGVETNSIQDINNIWDSVSRYKEFKFNLVDSKYIKPDNQSNDFFLINDKFDRESNLFVPTGKIDFNKISFMWDKINLTNKEDKVIEALQIIDSDIERIGFLINKSIEPIRIKKKNYDRLIPLSEMGEGMYRILTLAMPLVTAENGVLLIDEIKTGLHYKAQTDIWRLIIETATELNVQIFATTHSWDCIDAFQKALSQVKNKSVGKLFRLDSRYGELCAVEYNAEDLEVAFSKSIEVR